MPNDIEARPRLHEMSFDPVFGTHLWVEVLTDRVSESRTARLVPALLMTPAPGDGGPCGGEARLAEDGVAVAVGHAEVVQQAGHVEELGVVVQCVSLGQDRAPGVAAQTVVEQRWRGELGAERFGFPGDHRVRDAQAIRVDAESPGVRAAQQSSCLRWQDSHLQTGRVAEQSDALASTEDPARALSPGQRSDP
jgi:hypothetical protein